MIFDNDCDYYNEKRDSEFAPTNECESCYRYEICKEYFEKYILTIDNYKDVFLFIPDKKEILRISEGGGDNLSKEDIDKGYVSYIHYDIHKLDVDIPCINGGEILLTKPFRDQYNSISESISDVLDFVYGNKEIKIVILM